MNIAKLDNCQGFVVQSDLIQQFVDGVYSELQLDITTNCCSNTLTNTINEVPVTTQTTSFAITGYDGATTYVITDIKFNVSDVVYRFAGSYTVDGDLNTLVSNLEAWFLSSFGQTVTVTYAIVDDVLTLTFENIEFPVEAFELVYTVDDVDTKSYFSSTNNFSLIMTTNDYTIGQGVYTVILKATQTNGSTTTEKVCFFYDCTLACDIGEFLLENCDTDVHMDYFVLKEMEYCECKCENMCALYERILKKLDMEFCCDEVTNKPCTSC